MTRRNLCWQAIAVITILVLAGSWVQPPLARACALPPVAVTQSDPSSVSAASPHDAHHDHGSHHRHPAQDQDAMHPTSSLPSSLPSSLSNSGVGHAGTDSKLDGCKRLCLQLQMPVFLPSELALQGLSLPVVQAASQPDNGYGPLFPHRLDRPPSFLS